MFLSHRTPLLRIIIILFNTLITSASHDEMRSIPTLQSLCLTAKNPQSKITPQRPWVRMGLGNWYAQKVYENINDNQKEIDPLPYIVKPQYFKNYLKSHPQDLISNIKYMSESHKETAITFFIDAGYQINHEIKGLLHAACMLNQKKVVQLLLNLGANPNETDVWNQTPLFNIFEKKDLTLLHLLIKYGANINHKDCHGNTPLHHYLFCIHKTKLLIKLGADVNACNNENVTPLSMALYCPQVPIRNMHQLIIAGASIQQTFSYMEEDPRYDDYKLPARFTISNQQDRKRRIIIDTSEIELMYHEDYRLQKNRFVIEQTQPEHTIQSTASHTCCTIQ